MGEIPAYYCHKFLNAFFLVKEGTNNKTWISSYSAAQEKFENCCFVAVDLRTHKLWAFVYVTSKWLYAIDLSS